MMAASNILLGYCLVCGDPMAESVACTSHVQRSCPAAAVQVQDPPLIALPVLNCPVLVNYTFHLKR